MYIYIYVCASHGVWIILEYFRSVGLLGILNLLWIIFGLSPLQILQFRPTKLVPSGKFWLAGLGDPHIVDIKPAGGGRHNLHAGLAQGSWLLEGDLRIQRNSASKLAASCLSQEK